MAKSKLKKKIITLRSFLMKNKLSKDEVVKDSLAEASARWGVQNN